ncbi:MAG: GAF domain-containing protein [Anaerolineales bacterium]
MEQSNEQLEEAYEETQALTEQLAAEEEQLRKQAATLEKRTRYIEAAAEVGKAATSIYNLDEMLDQVVEMISERFGFYQTGIFLIDERSEFAEMVAASSEGGKRMLARGHKLKVGQEGMVGYVTSQGQARIALDVGDEAVYFSNPELPLTRSEMTLPMFYGGRIFGALDVQSTMEHAFTQEDISSLSVLADQVTMAINNARLIEELQSSLRSEREAFGEVSRQAWHNLIRRAGSWGYRFSNNRTNPTEKEWPQEMIRAMERQDMVIASDAKGALSIPIMVSGAPVGAIRVEKPAESVDWTEDEIDLIKTLTERLSQALESARVYQASQTQAIQEQLTTEISGQLRQTLDIDTVLKTAAKQLGDAFNAKEVVIRMAPDESRN